MLKVSFLFYRWMSVINCTLCIVHLLQLLYRAYPSKLQDGFWPNLTGPTKLMKTFLNVFVALLWKSGGYIGLCPPVKCFCWPLQGCASFVDHFCCLCLVFVMLSHLFITALWSPAGKGLTSWLLYVMSNCDFFHVLMWCLGQVWYLIVLIPTLCCLSYFVCHSILHSVIISFPFNILRTHW